VFTLFKDFLHSTFTTSDYLKIIYTIFIHIPFHQFFAGAYFVNSKGTSRYTRTQLLNKHAISDLLYSLQRLLFLPLTFGDGITELEEKKLS